MDNELSQTNINDNVSSLLKYVTISFHLMKPRLYLMWIHLCTVFSMFAFLICENICFILKYYSGRIFVCVFVCAHVQPVYDKHKGNKIELHELNSNGTNKPVWVSVPCCNWSILYISGNKSTLSWVELRMPNSIFSLLRSNPLHQQWLKNNHTVQLVKKCWSSSPFFIEGIFASCFAKHAFHPVNFRHICTSRKHLGSRRRFLSKVLVLWSSLVSLASIPESCLWLLACGCTPKSCSTTNPNARGKVN